MLRLLLLLFACRTAAPPPPSPPPPADGRTLVTADCTTARRQPTVIAMDNMTVHRLAPDATFDFTMRGPKLFLEVTGEPPKDLGTGSLDDLDFPASDVGEDGTFNDAKLPEGGHSYEHYRLRLDGCTVELVQSERDDIGQESEPAVSARYIVAPNARVWAR